MANDKKTVIKLTTPVFRAAFVQVFQPKAFREGDKPKFSLSMLFDAKAQATPEYKKIVDAVKTCIKNDFGGKRGPRFWVPIQNGDEGKATDWAGFPGCKYLNAKSDTKPGIVNKQGEDIIDPSEVYSGCFMRATITVYSYKTKEGGEGVAIGLGNLMKVGDGDPLNGRTSAQEDFKDAFEDVDFSESKSQKADEDDLDFN